MALNATVPHTASLEKMVRPFRAVLSALGRFFVDSIENKSRLLQIQYLSSLTDEELDARGLTRDAIPFYVNRDRMGI